MNHTKGKWKADDIDVYSEDNKHIAQAYDANDTHIADMDIEKARANAKLIAAAPDLLEALKFSLTIIDRLSDDYSTIANKHANFTQGEFKKIDKAIKKATS